MVYVFQEFIEVAVYHGRNGLFTCLMNEHRKESSVWKISPKVAASYGFGVRMVESLWLLSGLAAKLETIIANAGQEIHRCHAYFASALLTKKEPTAPNLHFCNLNLHFYNNNMAYI